MRIVIMKMGATWDLNLQWSKGSSLEVEAAMSSKAKQLSPHPHCKYLYPPPTTSLFLPRGEKKEKKRQKGKFVLKNNHNIIISLHFLPLPSSIPPTTVFQPAQSSSFPLAFLAFQPEKGGIIEFLVMNSYNQTTGFQFNPNSNGDGEDAIEFSGILEIFVHHARNIHNICIYDNQDVYAKFSLTYNPDETLSTKIINGGGKNPEFNENLVMTITQLDAVLKCEIWMLSRARNFMEDQLLGFALVPISLVVGKGKVTQDFSLSSTDLFHSPAGTVQLSLSLKASLPSDPCINSSPNSSITSEVVLLDRKISQVNLDPAEYSRIEFPDINVLRENQQMVSDYFHLDQHAPASFLHLGAYPQPVDDYEMVMNCSDENRAGSVSPNGSVQNSGFLSSTTTSLSDDRNSVDSIEKKNVLGASITTEPSKSSGACPGTPTSDKGSDVGEEKDSNSSNKGEESNKERNIGSVKFSQVFSAPLGNINLEPAESAMQQQIVDMYMRSMQQFTESLATMKLPMNLDKPESQDCGNVIQNRTTNLELEKKKKKDGTRVFYGSRAFF